MTGLTAKPVHAQLAQFLDSYCRVFGHEPDAEEIAAFEARQITRGVPAPFPAPAREPVAPEVPAHPFGEP
jgi:hypothetical protein